MSLKIMMALALLASPVAMAADETINLGRAGRATVSLEDNNGEYTLSIRLPSGGVQKIREEFAPFDFEGTESIIAMNDFDRDGADELVVRAMIPPHSGGLFVYRYSAKEKKFVAMNTGREARDTFLPVDAVAPLRVDRSGKVIARVLKRGENGESTEDREYMLENGKFRRVR